MAHPRVLEWTRENTSIQVPFEHVDQAIEFWDDD